MGPVRDRSELADLAWSRWVLRMMRPGWRSAGTPVPRLPAEAGLFSSEQTPPCGQSGW